MFWLSTVRNGRCSRAIYNILTNCPEALLQDENGPNGFISVVELVLCSAYQAYKYLSGSQQKNYRLQHIPAHFNIVQLTRDSSFTLG